MQALTISDVGAIDSEPRVRDLRLGEALGFDRPTNIRNTIKRNLEELSQHGLALQIEAPIQSGKGRTTYVPEYWLNESQALLVCMFARTEKAAAVRKQIIDVFLAYRRGELVRAGDLPPTPDPLVSALQRLNERLAALESAGKRLVKIYAEPMEEAMALSHAAEIWFDRKSKRKPRFWGDVEVRGIVLATHRQMTVTQAQVMIRARCGDDRTPSRSALHRFWLMLDRLRFELPSMRRH